jgi:hypothetical protein
LTIGIEVPTETLVIYKNRDFKWGFQNLDENGQPVDFPPGSLYFEFQTSPSLTEWEFVITGSEATLKVESTATPVVLPKTKWQLVFLQDGEAAGGDVIASGTVTWKG